MDLRQTALFTPYFLPSPIDKKSAVKVNIITQPLFCNYGGILQNYALQTILKKMGNEPLTINRPVPVRPAAPLWKEIAYIGKNLIKSYKGEWIWPTLFNYKANLLEHTLSFPQREFISKYINKVDITPPFTSDKLKDFQADAYIVGSDQVWRPWCSPFIENCFLDFIEDSTTKKIAYSASFGTDKWELSDEQTSHAKELIKNFDAISIREFSGTELCKKNLDIDAIVMPDPTLLLSSEDYLKLTSSYDYPEGRYLTSYILDPNSGKKNLIKGIAKKLNLEIVEVGKVTRNGFDSIERWLATIAHADFVVTDSFHGTVFSLIFNRKVQIISNNLRGNSRIESLLSSLNIKPAEVITPSSSISKNLMLLRERGLTFLRDSLSE